MPFSKLGLSDPIAKAVSEEGYTTLTPIQEQAIPVVLAGKDLLAAAQTGTGKTASFVLPILQKLTAQTELQGPVRAKYIRALILTPTRELCIQVEDNVQRYGKHLALTSMAMYGGVDLEPQKQRLIEGVDIVVATPGRLLDMVYQKALRFDELQVLVLDEADRMLDMGFIGDINKIIERLPELRQNLLFSATLSTEVRDLAKTSIFHAVEITIASDEKLEPKIDQFLITVDKTDKSSLLAHLIKEREWDQALIFISTKHGAAKLATQLQKRGITADAIHGDKSQAMRTKILSDFKSGELHFLVATGIAARGLDIDELSRVVNYDLPDEPDDYIHRIGRTGRAGASGEAISIVSKDDFRRLCDIESRLGHIIERRDLKEFVAQKVVPVSVLDFTPKHQPVRKSSPQGRQGEKNSASKGQQKSRSNDRGRSANKGSSNPRSGAGKPKSSGDNPWGKWQD